VTRTLVTLAVLAGGIAVAGPKPDSPPAPSTKPSAAVPEHRRIVGVLEVKVDGVSPEIASQFQQGLEAQLDSKHYWLAPRARMRELMANSTRWTEGCVVGECLHEVRTQTRADLVLLAALTGSGTSFGYVVTLVRTDTGRVLAQEQERCDVCTVSEALSAATLATIKILSAVPDHLPDDSVEQRAALDLATRPLENRLAKLASDDHRHTTLGIALTLVGLAAAAAGSAAYVMNNHTSVGVATAAAGAGLATGGVVTLTF
jgi:hypothetical protein